MDSLDNMELTFSYTIFEEILAERKRQDEKWGEQNHPMLEKELVDVKGHVVPSKDILLCQLRHCQLRNSCKPNRFDILFEEICEAFIETDPAKQREEMIQVAAVAVCIIEYLDRITQKEAQG